MGVNLSVFGAVGGRSSSHTWRYDRILRMNAFAAIVIASLLSRLGYQMARSPVLPSFAADLGALPELIGVIVAASTLTGVLFKLPSGALSDVLGRKRMMVLEQIPLDLDQAR